MPMALTKITHDPLDVRLYHITHRDNLASIVASGSLLPFNQLKLQALQPRSIAYSHLQMRRDSISVSIAPGGALHDYVPWSFAARSPMLYTAWRGNLGTNVSQGDIVHLVSDVRQAQELHLDFIFTDGHPLSTELSKYFNGLGDLISCLDWSVLCSHSWHNTEDDGDRKRRRQAEFLLHGAVPWSFVRGIAVQNQSVAQSVEAIVRQNTHQPKIVVLPDRNGIIEAQSCRTSHSNMATCFKPVPKFW